MQFHTYTPRALKHPSSICPILHVAFACVIVLAQAFLTALLSVRSSWETQSRIHSGIASVALSHGSQDPVQRRRGSTESHRDRGESF